MKKNPWKGLQSYQETDKIYGRDEEIKALYTRILYNIQTVVYGKSGIGKSSIINAGVIPRAKHDGMLPVAIRLAHTTKKEQTETAPYVEQIFNRIKEEVLKVGGDLEEIVPHQVDHEETIWELLHRYRIWEGKGEERKRLIPLLLFDQFEEIFTLEISNKRVVSFFSELADLLNEVKPAYLTSTEDSMTIRNDCLQKEEKEKTRNVFSKIADRKRGVSPDYLDKSEFHIVITLREDFLSHLERYTAYIPVMKQNRFPLLPLNEEQAAKIITEPIKDLVQKDVAEIIIQRVTGRKDFKLDGIPEIEVDAALLSLYMEQLYERKGNGNSVISSELVQFNDDIIKKFYESSIEGISEKTIEYLEDELITNANRRNNVARIDLISGGVSEDDLDKLIDKKVLRQFSYGGDLRIEFIHDILCPIVNDRIEHREQLKKEREEQKKREEEEARRKKEEEEEKAKREKERQKLEEEKRLISIKKTKNRRFTLLLLAAAIVLIVISIVISSMYIKNEKQSNKLDALNNEIRTILPSVIEQEIKDGNSYNAGKLLLKLFPDTLYMAGDPTRISLLRELSDSKSTILKGHTRSVNVAIFNHDGNIAITGSDDMTVKIWDSMTGSLISTINIGSPVISLAISPDDKRLVVSAKDGSIKSFSITQDVVAPQDSLAIKGSYARYVTYNPNGSEVLACYTNGDLLVCKSSNLAQAKSFKLNKKGATCISFDKGGKRMALAGTDNTIMIWDATLFKPIMVLSGHEDWVRFVNFGSDVESLVSCSDDKTVRLWNLRTKTCSVVEKLPDWATKAEFSPDGKRIISSSRDGVLRIVDVKTLCEIPEFQIKQSNSLKQFDLSPDGRRVMTCSTNAIVHIWDCGNPMETGVAMKLSGAVYGVSIFDDGKRIAAVSNNGTLGVWDAKTGNNIWKKEKEMGRVTSLSVSPDGKMIALSVGAKIRIFNTTNGEELEFDNTGGHRFWIRNLCFSHDGKTLASAGEDKLIVLWDMNNRKVKSRILGHTLGVYAIDFSKDDRRIVTGSADMTIRQWETTNGKQIGNSITGHKDVVLSVRYNSNDSLILSSSGDQTACIWETDGTLTNQFVGASGHMNDAIWGVTEDEIITASADKYIRIWCSGNAKETARLGGHFGGVSRLALSKDGILVSSDNLGGINVWKISDLETTANLLSQKYLSD